MSVVVNNEVAVFLENSLESAVVTYEFFVSVQTLINMERIALNNNWRLVGNMLLLDSRLLESLLLLESRLLENLLLLESRLLELLLLESRLLELLLLEGMLLLESWLLVHLLLVKDWVTEILLLTVVLAIHSDSHVGALTCAHHNSSMSLNFLRSKVDFTAWQAIMKYHEIMFAGIFNI